MFIAVDLADGSQPAAKIGYMKMEYQGREVVILARPTGKIIMGDSDFDVAAASAMNDFAPRVRVHDFDWMLVRFEGGSAPDRIYRVKVGKDGGMASTSLLTDEKFAAEVKKAFDTTEWPG